MLKIKAKGQSVRITEWIEMEGQTDRGDCITYRAITVNNNLASAV